MFEYQSTRLCSSNSKKTFKTFLNENPLMSETARAFCSCQVEESQILQLVSCLTDNDSSWKYV